MIVRLKQRNSRSALANLPEYFLRYMPGCSEKKGAFPSSLQQYWMEEKVDAGYTDL